MVEVVVGALVHDRSVLLAHRREDKHVYPGVWELPGGVAEDGESELDTLVRELREELDVAITPASATHLCRIVIEPGAGRAHLSAWLVRGWEGTPVNAAPEEHDDLRWFDLDDLPPPAHPPVRAALLAALRGPTGGLGGRGVR